jgi:hypothetical protein
MLQHTDNVVNVMAEKIEPLKLGSGRDQVRPTARNFR